MNLPLCNHSLTRWRELQTAQPTPSSNGHRASMFPTSTLATYWQHILTAILTTYFPHITTQLNNETRTHHVPCAIRLRNLSFDWLNIQFYKLNVQRLGCFRGIHVRTYGNSLPQIAVLQQPRRTPRHQKAHQRGSNQWKNY